MPYFTSLPELVSSQRLDLIPIPLHVLELVRDRHRDALDEAFCMAVAPTWMDGMEGHAALWLQRKQDTSIDPSWLARAIILRDARIIIGHMGFHFPPDARGSASTLPGSFEGKVGRVEVKTVRYAGHAATLERIFSEVPVSQRASHFTALLPAEGADLVLMRVEGRKGTSQIIYEMEDRSE